MIVVVVPTSTVPANVEKGSQQREIKCEYAASIESITDIQNTAENVPIARLMRARTLITRGFLTDSCWAEQIDKKQKKRLLIHHYLAHNPAINNSVYIIGPLPSQLLHML